jgi:hypothetical protein
MIPAGATMSDAHKVQRHIPPYAVERYAQARRQNFPVVVLTLTQGRSIGGYGG